MKKEQKQVKTDKINEILPLLWSSYKHIYEVRETNNNNSINFLMIVATFLPIFCITLYNTFFNCPLFLFPIIFQISALLILLKRFFIKGNIPWLESKDTLKRLNDNSFADSLFATLKAAEYDSYLRMKALKAIIKFSLLFLVFSIFLTILSYVFFIIEVSIYLYITSGVLIFLILLWVVFLINVPNSQFSSNEKKIKNDLDKWHKKK